MSGDASGAVEKVVNSAWVTGCVSFVKSKVRLWKTDSPTVHDQTTTFPLTWTVSTAGPLDTVGPPSSAMGERVFVGEVERLGTQHRER